MRDLVDDACSIFRAGVAAVSGAALMKSCLRMDNDTFWIGDLEITRDSVDRIVVVGAGKASGAMAVGFVEQFRPTGRIGSTPSGDIDFSGDIEIVGHVNVPEGCDGVPEELDWPPDLTLAAARPAGVNEPTDAAIAGTDRIIEWVHNATPRDLIVVLISGGGSALLCRPVPGISLQDKLAVIRHLSGSGADISQLNTVRKHLSAVKGGGLFNACGSASTMVTLILSDVLGDPLDLIASGPTIDDPSTPADALQVLSCFDPHRILPAAVYATLESAAGASTSERSVTRESRIADPQSSFRSEVMVIGNNAVAVDAAGIEAESRGYNHVMHSSRQGEDEAETVGERLADMTVEMLCRDKTLHRQDALITGGEPIVKLADDSIRGRGGRNQQLVLAAYRRLLQIGLTEAQWSKLTILSGGTDGEDGPTAAAGAWIDARVHHAAVTQGLSPDSFLARNDAYTFFEQTGGLLVTGPTGTNVCDLRVAIIDAI